MASEEGEIILPATPPVAFAATKMSGSTPICSAAERWSIPKSAPDEVSEPVKNTPSHPRKGES